eukprot:gene5402-biopygen4213
MYPPTPVPYGPPCRGLPSSISSRSLRPPAGGRARRNGSGRGPDAGRTIAFKGTGADRTRAGRGPHDSMQRNGRGPDAGVAVPPAGSPRGAGAAPGRCIKSTELLFPVPNSVKQRGNHADDGTSFQRQRKNATARRWGNGNVKRKTERQKQNPKNSG